MFSRPTPKLGLSLALASAALVAVGLYWAFRHEPSMRDVYRDYSPSVLGVVEPIEALDIAKCLDGGTIVLTVQDAKKQALRTWFFRGDWDDDARLDYPPIFIGDRYPDPADQSVAFGGPEEAAIYGLLLRWLERQPENDEIAKMTPEMKYDERYQYLRQKSGEKSLDIYTLLHVDILLRLFEKRLPRRPPDG